MPVESAADRLVFLNSAEFGVEVTYGGATIKALWLTKSDQFSPGGEAAITASSPACLVRTADVPSLDTGTHPKSYKTLTYGGATWYIVRWEHDGQGMTTLYLTRSTS